MKPSMPYTADELAVIEAEQSRLEKLITAVTVGETCEAQCPVCSHILPDTDELCFHIKKHAGQCKINFLLSEQTFILLKK